jgi:hypothetical protein
VGKIEKEDHDSSSSVTPIGKNDVVAGHEPHGRINPAVAIEQIRSLKTSLSDFAWLVRNISIPELVAMSSLVMMYLYVYVHPLTLPIVPTTWIAYALCVDHRRSKRNPYRIQFNDGFKRGDVSPT